MGASDRQKQEREKKKKERDDDYEPPEEGYAKGGHHERSPRKDVKERAGHGLKMEEVALLGAGLVIAGVVLFSSRNSGAASGAFAMVKAAGRAL